jgi:hypothetical protein
MNSDVLTYDTLLGIFSKKKILKWNTQILIDIDIQKITYLNLRYCNFLGTLRLVLPVGSGNKIRFKCSKFFHKNLFSDITRSLV